MESVPVDLKAPTSAQSPEERVNLFLSYPTSSLLSKEEMGEEQVKNLYSNILEATFLVPSEVCVHVGAQKVR